MGSGIGCGVLFFILEVGEIANKGVFVVSFLGVAKIENQVLFCGGIW